MDHAGKIIFLSGASSSGKSTLAAALQSALPIPFWRYSIDHLNAAKILPQARIDSQEFAWAGLREMFFDGFHRSLPAFAIAGNNLIVEHIVENEEWFQRLRWSLAGIDVFYVGVHCPLAELERRERERGDRRIGEALEDLKICHRLLVYDFEVDSTDPLEENVEAVITAWTNRH